MCHLRASGGAFYAFRFIETGGDGARRYWPLVAHAELNTNLSNIEYEFAAVRIQ